MLPFPRPPQAGTGTHPPSCSFAFLQRCSHRPRGTRRWDQLLNHTTSHPALVALTWVPEDEGSVLLGLLMPWGWRRGSGCPCAPCWGPAPPAPAGREVKLGDACWAHKRHHPPPVSRQDAGQNVRPQSLWSCLGPGVAAPRPLAPAPGAHGRTDGRTDGRQPATAAPGPGAGFSRRLVVLWLWHFYPAFPCLPLGASRCGEEKRGCLQLGAGLLAEQLCPEKPSADPK